MSTETIKAVAYLSGQTDSNVTSATYTIAGLVATPTFSPPANTYSTNQTVTIDCSTPGASIYYTTDGSTPTTSSTPYTTAISVAGDGTTETIKAIAVETGMGDSAVASATYVINFSQVSTPTFSLAAGTYSTDQSITITCGTAGASVYYTTDGSTPTTSSTLYTAPISVAGNGTSETIQAIGVKAGMHDSTVAAAAYSIVYQVAAPVFSPSAGTYTTDQSVTITCATTGASIYYTTDGTRPTSSSTPYTGPISIAGNGTFRYLWAIATKAGWANSTAVLASYTIMYPQVATPTFSVAAGTYATDQSVSISTSTPGASIYYTTNNTKPTTSSPVYSGPISVAGNGVSVTISAIAVEAGMTNSSTAVATYTIYDTWQTFGTRGSGTDQLANPQAAVVAASGKIYISDMSNNRIVSVDDMSGTNWTTFTATFGSGTNQFEYPAGIAFDSSGRIYIADPQNNRIVRMDDLSGTNWVALTGSGVNQFNHPMGIAVDSSGHIYVVDGGNRVIRVDDMTGTNWLTFGSTGSGIDQFSDPTAIALGGSGQIYVADGGNNRIVRIDDMSGTNWTTFGSAGSGVNQFSSPFGVTVDGSGRIYIADTGNSRIVRINDMSGTSWTSFGSSGNGINQFANPVSVALDASGRLYVADSQDYRVVSFVLP